MTYYIRSGAVRCQIPDFVCGGPILTAIIIVMFACSSRFALKPFNLRCFRSGGAVTRAYVQNASLQCTVQLSIEIREAKLEGIVQYFFGFSVSLFKLFTSCSRFVSRLCSDRPDDDVDGSVVDRVPLSRSVDVDERRYDEEHHGGSVERRRRRRRPPTIVAVDTRRRRRRRLRRICVEASSSESSVHPAVGGAVAARVTRVARVDGDGDADAAGRRGTVVARVRSQRRQQ